MEKIWLDTIKHYFNNINDENFKTGNFELTEEEWNKFVSLKPLKKELYTIEKVNGKNKVKWNEHDIIDRYGDINTDVKSRRRLEKVYKGAEAITESGYNLRKNLTSPLVRKLAPVISKNKLQVVNFEKRFHFEMPNGNDITIVDSLKEDNEIEINLYIQKGIPYTLEVKPIFEEKDYKYPEYKNTRLIFAPTHQYEDDVLAALVSANRLTYTLFGSLPLYINSFNGLLLDLCGVVPTNRASKYCRSNSVDAMVKALELGADLTVFSEAVLNKTMNKLVLHLFKGIYLASKNYSGNSLVVPMAFYLKDNIFYVTYGKAFDIRVYGEELGMQKLRDEMATLKYELYNTFGKSTRQELKDRQIIENLYIDELWEKDLEVMIDEIIKNNKAPYDRNVEDNSHFTPKNITEKEEVFEESYKDRYNTYTKIRMRR